LEGQKVLYIPELYGFIESPVNQYTIPKKKPSDATKYYLTNSEYRLFFSFLWDRWDLAIRNNDLQPIHQMSFLCVIAGELGLRLQEILGLQLKHLNLDDNVCLVTKGKGSKGSGYRKREVPINDFVKASLKDFLKCFPRGRNDYLFQNHKGKELSKNTAHNWRAKIIEEIKEKNLPIIIEKGFGFHAFRRTYARSFLENGGNFMNLQKYAGWKYSTTASHYIGEAKPTINPGGI